LRIWFEKQMGSDEEKFCTLCGEPVDNPDANSLFVQAGEWLAEEHWKDSGALCSICLESRGRLAMMYLHEMNR
jgi:hypothetical protein